MQRRRWTFYEAIKFPSQYFRFPMRYASIDIGSNTVRLLLAERSGKEDFHSLRVERKITRLGGNYSAREGLDGAAVLRTLKALRGYARLLQREKVEAIFAVATGVVREAPNGQDFLERVRGFSDIPVRLISGEEEAAFMWQGVRWSLKENASHRLAADMGGWSTEILWVEGGKPKRLQSLPLGVVDLGERFLHHDPPTADELRGLEMHIRETLEGSIAWLAGEGLPGKELHPYLVGTAGTMTTLAAIDLGLRVYDPEKTSHHQMTFAGLQKMYHRLCSLTLWERAKVPGLERGREDLIVPGTASVLGLLDVFRLQGLMVIDSGLLEGVLLDGLSRLS